MVVISRQQAKLNNLKKYFTGKPCSKGHTAERRVSNGTCTLCELDLANSYAAKNRNKQAENSRQYYASNKEKVKEQHKDWIKRNPERKKELFKVWVSKNRERRNELLRKWKKANPNKVKADNAKRRAQKRKALPRWANLDKIKEIYLNCPEGMQVDHIVPLINSNVCGLHVENNLQYLTPFENNSKNNRYDSN